jgi:hypothetical protein
VNFKKRKLINGGRSSRRPTSKRSDPVTVHQTKKEPGWRQALFGPLDGLSLVVIVLDDHGLAAVMVMVAMMVPDDDNRICIRCHRRGHRHHRKSSKRQNELPHWDIFLMFMFSHQVTILKVEERSK